MHDAAIWFFASGKQQQGPYTLRQMREFLRAGQFAQTDMVWRDGMPAWQAAGSLQEFSSPAPLGPPPLPRRGPAAPLPEYKPQELPPAVRWLIPIDRSIWAIAAGYLGLFSVLVVFAPFALITGIIAMYEIKRNPRKHGMGRAVFGLIMGFLGCLIGLLMILAAASN